VAVLPGSAGPFAVTNRAVGDAPTMSGKAVGGNDTLTGGGNIYGDAGSMSESAKGGNDTLTGGTNTGTGTVSNILFGDARVMSGSAQGGDDTLQAGTAVAGGTVSNEMWGDGQLSDSAQGGTDLFVFKDDGSMTVGTQNTIEDFSQSQQDQIAFSGVAGVQSFADLIITQSGADTIITAGADQVTLHNFTNSLTTNDFLFV